MNVRTFHLVEAEPHPLVAEALSADLFSRCRIDNPVPVHFLPMPRWGGMCPAVEDTRAGEVELAEDLLDDHKDPAGMRDSLVHVYLHEFAHRLAPGHSHNPAFVAVNALLLTRAGGDRFDRLRLHDIDLYALQDFDWVEHCTIGEALDWALDQADELAATDLTAEACAEEIVRRFEKWKAWKSDTPKREAEAAAKADAARRKTTAIIRGLQAHVERLKQARFQWLAVGIIAGMLINLVFLVLLKGV